MMWVYRPDSVENVESFRAHDPWNGDQPTTFYLDRRFEGGMLPLAVAYEDASRPQEYAIHSEIDPEYHVLPDSLTALWKDRRIRCERLPVLLKQLEPGLIRSDYFRLLALPRAARGVRLWAAPVLGVFWLLLGIVMMFASGFGGGVLVVLGALVAAISMNLSGKWTQRRQYQVSWLLANRAA